MEGCLLLVVNSLRSAVSLWMDGGPSDGSGRCCGPNEDHAPTKRVKQVCCAGAPQGGVCACRAGGG